MEDEEMDAIEYISQQLKEEGGEAEEAFVNPITAGWKVKDPAAPVTTLEEQECSLGKLSDLTPDIVHTMPVPTIQNVVCSVNLGCPLEPKKIALNTRNSEYNPKRFAAVIMKIRNPRATALVFGSGKMVCTGARSESDIYLAARKFARIIQKLGFPVRFFNFRIHNLVGSVDSKFPVRIENIAKNSDTHNFATFEPELYPGLIFRMVKPKVVLLIFVSGKVLITGGKSKEDIYESYRNIFPLLWRNRKTN